MVNLICISFIFQLILKYKVKSRSCLVQNLDIKTGNAWEHLENSIGKFIGNGRIVTPLPQVTSDMPLDDLVPFLDTFLRNDD